MNKVSFYILSCILVLFALTGCNVEKQTDWNSNFVVYNNNLYEVTQEKSDAVDKEIGEIDKYVEHEGSYDGVFSNKFKAGSKLYTIKNKDLDEAIAVKDENGDYVVTKNTGKYDAKESN